MPMVFSNDLLFLHVPKTGGVSISTYLLETLPRPVHYVRPQAFRDFRGAGFVHIEGEGHYSIEDADRILREHGFRFEAFPVVLAVIRNPYDWAVSHYAYGRRPNAAPHRIGPLELLARERDFRDFLLEAANRPELKFMAQSYSYIHRADRVPANLKVLRYEHFAEEVKTALDAIGIRGDAEMPWLNQSEHGDYVSYYDEETEAVIYDMQRWMFDEGYYERLRLAEIGAAG